MSHSKAAVAVDDFWHKITQNSAATTATLSSRQPTILSCYDKSTMALLEGV